MSAAIIDVDDLIEFVDELRLAGYDISTQQYIGAQNLLLGLAANDHLPPDPRALQTWLAPVLCSSPREQENFYRRFDRWVTRNPRLTQRETSKKDLDETRLEEVLGETWFRSSLQLKFLLPLATVLLIVGGIIFALPRIPRTLTGKIVDNDSKHPLANARVSFVGKTSVSDSNGEFATAYRSKDLPNTLTVDYSEYETATVTVTAENKSALLISLQKLPTPTPEPPSPTGTPTPIPTAMPGATPIPTVTKVATPVQPNKRNYLRWIRLGGVIFPFFLLGMWWLWKRKLSRALLQKYQSANQPRLDQIVVKGAAGQLFLGQSFRRTIQELRRHRQRGASELDATRTVQRTIQKGGLFSPFYGARQTLPEYLVLIDRASFQDQQARLEDEIIRRLVADNVFVDSYYFQGDPRVCRKQERDAHFVTLQEMAALHPDHHLIIFSDGSTFINPLTGEPERWLEMFAPWTKRAVMTPELPAHWSYREWALAELDFIMLPATKEGLAALTEVIDSGTTPRMDRNQRARPFPAMLRERPRRWLENNEPPLDLANRLCDQLKLFLGSKGYFWLSACAVYPILYWDLTLYLGFKLFRDRSEIEDRLLSLVRLPWFRYGTLPDWLRLKLISELPLEDEKTIRGALEELFLTVLQQPAEGIRLDLASREEGSGRGLRGLLERLRKGLTNWKFKRFLWQFLKDEPPESPLRDYVFLAFMSGRKPRKLTVSVPDAVRRLFFPRGQMALGLRPVSALALAALCSLAVFFINLRSTAATSADIHPNPEASPTPLRLYAQMSPDEQTQFVRTRAQEISEKLGPGSYALSEEAVVNIKFNVDAYAKRVGNNSSTPMVNEDLRFVLPRAIQYAPTINQAFAQRQVPPVVGLYIPMIETEYNNTAAEAPGGQAGLFSFVKTAARSYGVDPSERANVAKIAPAAASYVADSMSDFGTDSRSMTLVVLSYEIGAGAVRRYEKQLDVNPTDRDFWFLAANVDKLDSQFREHLNYVPQFFAAAIVGENPLNFGLQMDPLSSYTVFETQPDTNTEITDLIAKFTGPERRNASDQLVQLYDQNKQAVIKALIDGLLNSGPDSYRVNLYIARTLGSIRPNWEGTAEQLSRVQALQTSRNYQDPTFKVWVDKAISGYVEQIGVVAPSPTVTQSPTPTLQSTTTPSPPGSANLVATPTTVEAGQSVNFNIRGSFRAQRIEFRFTFGDGSSSGWGSDDVMAHTYSSAGVYIAHVEVRLTNNGTSTVVVSNALKLSVLPNSALGKIPNLFGKPESEVRAMFNPKMEFSLGAVTYTNNSSLPAGTVVSQNPPAGTAAPNGTKIDIVVANGSVEQQRARAADNRAADNSDAPLVEVPDLVGLPLVDATKRLSALGLRADIPPKSNLAVVRTQSPTPGTKVTPGTRVKLR